MGVQWAKIRRVSDLVVLVLLLAAILFCLWWAYVPAWNSGLRCDGFPEFHPITAGTTFQTEAERAKSDDSARETHSRFDGN